MTGALRIGASPRGVVGSPRDTVFALWLVGVALHLRGSKVRYVGHVDRLTDAHKRSVQSHRVELGLALRRLTLASGVADYTPRWSDWEREWVTRMLEAAGAGGSETRRDPPPHNSRPSEMPAATPTRHAHVSHVEHPPRYRCTPSLGADRVCCVCGERRGPDGPLAYQWDAHAVGLAMVLTCSAVCRAQARASAGGQVFAERKPALHGASASKAGRAR